MSHDIYHAYKTSHDFNHDEKLRFLSVNKIKNLYTLFFPFTIMTELILENLPGHLL